MARRHTAVLFFLAAIFILPLVTRAASANLITNPSFEDGTTLPTSWSESTAAKDKQTFTYPVAGEDGAKAARIDVTTYKSGDIFWMPANAPVVVAQQYQFSAYSMSNVPAYVIATYLNSKGTAVSYATLGTVPASSGWQQFSATITIPKNVTQVRIQQVIRAVGFVEVDNYSLTAAGSTPPPPPPPPTAPVINSFIASPSTITSGESSTLSWSVASATTLSISQGVGAVSGTTKSVSPTATTTYMLTAANSAGTTTATAVVNVIVPVAPPPPPPPVPACSLSANPSSILLGGSTTLTFSSTNALTASINNGVGAVPTSGTKSVSPASSVQYTGTFAGAGGTTTCQASVTVTQAPPPPPSNLIPNGNLEAGSANNPTGWNADYWGNLTAKFTYPVAGNGGGKAAQVQITKYKTGDAKWDFNHIIDSSHTVYNYTEDYSSNVKTNISIEYLMKDGTYDYEWVKDAPATSGWSSLSIQITVPTNAVSFTVLHTLISVGTLTIDNAVLTAPTADPFPQGMVTLAFDDGLLSQYQNALPILNAANMKGSFYIITTEPASGDTGYMTWAQIKALNTAGDEIGGHTRTHPYLTTVTAAKLTNEVSGSYTDLVAQGITPKTFAYPYGDVDNAVEVAVKAAAYQAARGSYFGLNTPATDHYDLYDIRLDTTSNLATVEQEIDQAVADKRWIVFEIHDVLASGGDEYSITPAFFQSVVSYLAKGGASVVTTAQGEALLSK